MNPVRIDLGAVPDSALRTAVAELPVSLLAVGADERPDVGVTRGRLATPVAGRIDVVVSPDPAAPADRPAILVRPRLRPDVVEQVLAHRGWFPRIEVEVAATAADLRSAVVDAAGWVRVLADTEAAPEAGMAPGAGVVVGAAAVVGDGVLAEATAGRSVVVWQVRRKAVGDAMLRVLAVGPTRIDVRVHGAAGETRVRVSDESGDHALAARWESSERLALRRAVDAVRGGAIGADAAEFSADSAVADRLLHGISEADERDRQPRIP